MALRSGETTGSVVNTTAYLTVHLVSVILTGINRVVVGMESVVTNTTEHCSCKDCANYKFIKDWNESNGTKKWRNDGRCGINYRLPDGTPGQCDPDGENPCCGGNWNERCGSKTEHCSCEGCTDYKIMYNKWRDSNRTQKWRYDGRCGRYYPLPDGTPAQCNPDGDKPCCSSGLNRECGNTTEHGTFYPCTDYRIIYKDWNESNGTKKWRYDGMCGKLYPLPDGTPGQCDPDGENPCCSNSVDGHCSIANTLFCLCTDCVDYKLIRDIRNSAKNCTLRKYGGFLKLACFD